MKITALDGNICDKHGKVIGDYRYSFRSCRFSFQINGHIYHFWHKEELEKFLEDNNYHVSTK